MNKILFLLLVFCGFTGCAYVETSFDAADFTVEIPEDTSLEVAAGRVEYVDRLDAPAVICQVYFEAVRGGETYFLGLIKVKEANGHDEPRLKWIDSEGQVIETYSVSDLKHMPIGEGVRSGQISLRR